MSKVENYIRKNTNQFSNEDGFDYVPWLTPDQARRAVEIAREEIIEKVCEFLENELDCYIKARVFTIEYQRLENDLRKAMKDE